MVKTWQLKISKLKKKRKKFSFTETRFMKFLGGKDLLFALLSLVLIGIVIFIFDKISYVLNHLSSYLIQL